MGMFAHIPLHYLWWILALLLMAGEVMLPGYFLLWIGLAAAAMGLVVLMVPTLGVLPQALLFAALGFVSCLVYWKWVKPRLERDDPEAAHLNRRAQRLIGQRYELVEAIVNGRGRARVGDGLWRVEGPDLPVGSVVEVVDVEGATLKVRAAG
jgi:membrane protein implicated in regulation of membrane protease activity